MSHLLRLLIELAADPIVLTSSLVDDLSDVTSSYSCDHAQLSRTDMKKKTGSLVSDTMHDWCVQSLQASRAVTDAKSQVLHLRRHIVGHQRELRTNVA